MRGWNSGVMVTANIPDPCPFVANGKVDEAYGDFEMWINRNVHIQGLVYWLPDGSLPDHAEGIFRIN